MSGEQHINEDPLLAALGEMARAEEQVQGGLAQGGLAQGGLAQGDLAQLEALLQGDLHHGELEELERRAATAPELAHALEAYRPLGDAAQQRIAGQILQSLPSRAQTTAAPDESASVVELASRRRPRRPALRFAWLAMPLAAAAALLLWLAVPGTGPAPIPGYELSASGGQQELRGTEKVANVDLQPQSTLTLTLRPATAVDGAIEARAFLVLAGGELQPVAFAARVSPAGAMQLSGTASSLFGQARGLHVLRVVIGRAELLRSAAQALARGAEDTGPGWQRLTLKVALLDSPQ